jgi:hypothetical protein
MRIPITNPAIYHMLDTMRHPRRIRSALVSRSTAPNIISTDYGDVLGTEMLLSVGRYA